MPEKIVMRFPGGCPKALTLSYDDGVEQDIKMIEILDRYGLKCTFNINSGLYAPEGTVYEPGKIHRRMTESAVTKLYSSGDHEVAVHGYKHAWLDRLPTGAMALEVVRDKDNLEKQFGRIIRGMAYAYGTYSDQTVECLRSCGIVYSRTTRSTEKFDIPTDWLRLPATCHHNAPRLMELAKKFVEMKNGKPQLFYLWGHTYEFEANDNWNVIEEFAECVSGKDDIWYATNIDIYDYIDAYNRLQFSADLSRVYNPTARTLCFTTRESMNAPVIYVAPGETVTVND